MARAAPQLAIIAILVSGVLSRATFVATTASVVLPKRRIVHRRIPARAGTMPRMNSTLSAKASVRASCAGDDAARAPVEDISGGVDDGQRSDHDVAKC